MLLERELGVGLTEDGERHFLGSRAGDRHDWRDSEMDRHGLSCRVRVGTQAQADN
jgi:hypothetical protein